MGKIKVNTAYIDFLRYTIGNEKVVPESVTNIDWYDFYIYCNRQGITGLVFDGIKRSGIRLDIPILFEWMGSEQFIIQQNALSKKRIKESTDFFSERKLRSCILKGQANALMYPRPEIRSPGDIDIWVEGKCEDIIKIVKNVCPNAHYSFHHIKMPLFEDVSVEVHYRPICFYNWYSDKILQRYIDQKEKSQFENKVDFIECKIGHLTSEFNAVYQVLHMYSHFLSSRNNFKQFIDYYYLLKKGLSKDEKKECAYMFKRLGVTNYAEGIMWIMKNVFDLDDSLLISNPNEKVGELILNESAYFGTYSTNKTKYVLEQFVANFRIIRMFPKEVIIYPLFLVWHQWWKVKMSWALKKVS